MFNLLAVLYEKDAVLLTDSRLWLIGVVSSCTAFNMRRANEEQLRQDGSKRRNRRRQATVKTKKTEFAKQKAIDRRRAF